MIGKRIISILLMMCLCVTVLAGCESSGAATAPAGTTADNSTAQESSQKILGIIGDATLSSEQADVEALCESCGVDFWGYADYTWLASDEEKAAEDAISLIADYGCTTIIFAVKGTEQIADQFSLQHPEIEVIMADIAKTTDAVSGDLPSEAPALDNGIIVVNASYGRSYTYKSTGIYKCQAFTVDLDKIDPETGSVTHIRTFSNEDTYSCSAYLRNIGGNTADAMRSFNSDMSLMTATVTLESGAKHIGWVDENGQFTDVSEKITVESDFGALTTHTCPCFFENYIYFRDCTNTSIQVKRVPMDNLTVDAVEVMVDGCFFVGNIYPLPDGTASDTASTYEYFDSSMQYPARTDDFYDWVSEDICVGNGPGSNDPYIIYKYQLSGESDIFHWYSEKTTFIPSVKNRINWNAVVSPNGEQVAFLSKLTSGADQSTSLFLISIDGGEPIKVDTDYTFSADECGMIDWR